MSALLHGRGVSERMCGCVACLYVYYRLSGAGHSPLGADCCTAKPQRHSLSCSSNSEYNNPENVQEETLRLPLVLVTC